MEVKSGILACLLAAVIAAQLTTAVTARAGTVYESAGELRRDLVTGNIARSVTAGEFIVARYDDFGWASYQIAALRKASAKTPLVVVVGGSAVRECVIDDEELAAAIKERDGPKARVFTFASAMQRLPSTLAIIDNLPEATHGGVVVIGVHHLSFVATEADARGQLTGTPLVMSSPALRDVVAERFGGKPSTNMLPGLQRFLDWYQSKRGVPAFQGAEQTYKRHRYDERGALATSTKQALVPRFTQTLGASPNGAFFTYFDFNVALLERCVSEAREKGYRVLLMQDPIDGVVVGTSYDAYEKEYRPVVQRIVRQQDARYVDLNPRAALADADFYDLFHLLPSGRAKWTPMLAAAVAPILRASAQQAATAAASPSPTQTRAGDDERDERVEKVAPDRRAEAPRGGEGLRWWHYVVLVLAVLTAAFLLLLIAARRAAVRRRRRRRARERRRARLRRPASPVAGGLAAPEIVLVADGGAKRRRDERRRRDARRAAANRERATAERDWFSAGSEDTTMLILQPVDDRRDDRR